MNTYKLPRIILGNPKAHKDCCSASSFREIIIIINVSLESVLHEHWSSHPETEKHWSKLVSSLSWILILEKFLDSQTIIYKIIFSLFISENYIWFIKNNSSPPFFYFWLVSKLSNKSGYGTYFMNTCGRVSHSAMSTEKNQNWSFGINTFK